MKTFLDASNVCGVSSCGSLDCPKTYKICHKFCAFSPVIVFYILELETLRPLRKGNIPNGRNLDCTLKFLRFELFAKVIVVAIGHMLQGVVRLFCCCEILLLSLEMSIPMLGHVIQTSPFYRTCIYHF